jgi:DnaJ family protein C protein 3
MTLVEEKYGKGEYRQVLEDVNTALAIYPSSQLNSKLREWECKAHSELKEFKKAITACSLWHESDSNALDALLLRAEAHAQNEDFDSALRDLEKAAQLAPRDGNVRQKIQQMNNRKRIAERKDYYKVLGIPRDASVKEIRRAYRQLALEWHPDKNRDDPAKHELSEKKYQEITEAYEILTDEEKRRRYDSGEDLNQPQGHHGHPFQQGGGGPFHFNFNFGGNAGFGGF